MFPYLDGGALVASEQPCRAPRRWGYLSTGIKYAPQSTSLHEQPWCFLKRRGVTFSLSDESDDLGGMDEKHDEESRETTLDGGQLEAADTQIDLSAEALENSGAVVASQNPSSSPQSTSGQKEDMEDGEISGREDTAAADAAEAKKSSSSPSGKARFSSAL